MVAVHPFNEEPHEIVGGEDRACGVRQKAADQVPLLGGIGPVPDSEALSAQAQVLLCLDPLLSIRPKAFDAVGDVTDGICEFLELPAVLLKPLPLKIVDAPLLQLRVQRGGSA